MLAGGELLASGEVRLAEGKSYTSPWTYFVHSATGLDGISHRLHRMLRARPHHPRSPRPVILNTWEAVYFDHDLDLDTLQALAERAQQVGVERFVLDDGWFRGRRNDTAGLGDWYVDDKVWPDGLHPVVDHVHSLGMRFALWVEPEMINLDSDLARSHPDWLLAASGRPTASKYCANGPDARFQRRVHHGRARHLEVDGARPGADREQSHGWHPLVVQAGQRPGDHQ
ncbi:alpha-galactosidase [Streptomyces sp. bgisy031]|uniref:alpha-galactosidase n=1 Tax=Streptomyces sp. bgisy031 TaxID=3413772 RepID=UPI003D725A98